MTFSRTRHSVGGNTTRPAFSRILPRTRLFERFDEALQHPILWITAPAGAGKTVAVSSYIGARGLNELWYPVDERDEDPARFFLSLGIAARSLAPDDCSPLPLLTPEFLPGLGVFSRNFFDDLFRRMPPPAVLVLDNYQDVSVTAALHEALRNAGSLLPLEVRLIVLSRAEPPPAFARLRTHGDLSVLGWDQLRLNLDEAQALADIRRGMAVPHEIVAQCHASTQGWTAGLVLLLDHTPLGALPETPIQDRSHGLLFDYFAGEIFAVLPAATQAILLQMALLPVLTPSLAQDLTGAEEAGCILADLHRKDFFIAQRAQAESSYEFHPLFREFLLARARKTLSADRLRELRVRAADLLLEAGQPEEAAALSIETGDWPKLAAVIGSLSPVLLAQGRQQTLLEWLAAIPPEILQRDGWLLYWRGLAQLSHDPAGARQGLENAYQVFDRQDDSTGLYLCWAAIVESFFLAWADFRGLDLWLSRIVELRQRHPAFPSPQIEVQVYIALVIMTYRNPGYPELPSWAEHARGMLESDLDSATRLRLCAHLINYYVWKTDLNQAAWVLAVARRMADAPGMPPLYLAVSRMFGAMFAWMTGFGEECLRLVADGIEQAHGAGLHAWDFHFNIQNVYGALILGRTKEAEVSLAAAFPLLRNHRYIDAGYYYFVAGLLAEQRGDCGSAVDHLESAISMTERGGAPIPLATVHLALAMPLFRQGDIAGAERQLERARCLSEKTGSGLVRYLCELQSARMALDGGERENALMHLARGLSLSRGCGGLVCGGWGPAVMAQLYAVALDAEIEVPYVRGLIRRIGLTPPDPAAAPERWPWPIRIYTLGHFEILIDNDVLRSNGKAQRKPLDLLKALIAFGGRAVPEARLCEALWPEADGDAAHRDFSTTLHRLRKLLTNDQALRIEHGCLSLDENRVWVDVWAFERCVARTETAKDGALDPAELPLPLYRGDFLPDETSAGALALRERLRTKYTRRAERLGGMSESSGDGAAAEEWYRQALEADPFREATYGRLMRCYDSLGRRAEALALYQRCRKLFLARLGIMPGRDLQALYQRLSAIPDAPPVDGPGP